MPIDHPGPGLPRPPLLLITDRSRLTIGGRGLVGAMVDLVRGAVAGGCRWVSLREKDLDPAAQADLITALLPILRAAGGRLTVHGGGHGVPSGDPGAGALPPPVLDLARLCDGVHLPDGGPDGGDAAAARAALGPGALIGVSCHSGVGMIQAAQDGADYATLSPLFPTESKPGYGPALGPAGLAAALAALKAARPGERPFPVIGLGGIGPGNAAGVMAAGAAGIAVMGGVMGSADPAAAVRALLAALQTPEAAGPGPG
ncbi:MAG: hypothetical protein RLY86_2317 [Pseudomonadota bacterium]|jgi:thiamine-phosphate pyrophosphorylase